MASIGRCKRIRLLQVLSEQVSRLLTCSACLQMFFRELPQEINPGRIPLTPLDRAARFVTPCDACGEFTPRRIVVLCGHIYCLSCCRTQESPEGLQLFCAVCKQHTIGERNEIGESFLKSMKFACSCGQEGSLTEIKAHLAKGDVEHSLYDEMEQTPLVSDVLYNNIRPLQQMRSSSPPTVLNRRKAYFCFELQKRIDEFMQTKITQETSSVAWTSAEYPIEVFCKIAAFSGECFLGVYIRMLGDHPSFSSWPIKRNISFELYNTNGESVHKKEAATFAEGKTTWKGFIFACRPNNNKGWGFKKFCSLEKLISPEENLLCNGAMCVSVEFQDLDYI